MHLKEDREAALAGLKSMACLALRDDSLELDLEAVKESPYFDNSSRASRNPKLVANVGEDLELVERTGRRLRFRRSLVQAYLAARGLSALVNGSRDGGSGEAADGDGYPTNATLERSSREFLIALVMSCCLNEGQGGYLRERLLTAATNAPTPGRFDRLAAACESMQSSATPTAPASTTPRD